MFEKNKLHPITMKHLKSVLAAADRVLENRDTNQPATDFGSNSERAKVVSENDQLMQSSYEALMSEGKLSMFPRKAKKFQDWLAINHEDMSENLEISDDGNKVTFSI